MLDFDSQSFFETMDKLFIGEPWRFLTNCGKYRFKNLRGDKNVDPKQPDALQSANEETVNKLCSVPIADKILSVFKVAAERSNRKEPEFTKASF